MVLMFLVSFFALLFLAVIPLLLNIQKHSQNLAAEKAISEILEKQIRDLENFTNQSSSLQETLGQVDDFFLNFSAPVDFFEFLEQQAQKDNVELDALPVFADSSDKHLHINFQILTAGSFPACLKFLEQLEASPFSFEVSELSIVRIGKNETRFKQFKNLSEGNVIFSIILKAFAKEKNVID